jgi:hypothetical protein
MSMTNSSENKTLLLFFNNTAFALIGNAGGLLPSSVAGSFYVSLHTADPGEAGDQTTSETAYTNYLRVAVARSGAGWTVSGNGVTNAAAVAFAQCGATGATLTHFGIGTDSSGAGVLLFSGTLGPTTLQGPFTGATNDNVTIPGHSLSVDDRVAFYPTYGSSLPTGIAEGTLYWVKTSATDVITISTTQGGGTLDITVSGDGIAVKATPLVVANLITPSFAIGDLSLIID